MVRGGKKKKQASKSSDDETKKGPPTENMKARLRQNGSEYTRNMRRVFCIPPAAFARVARSVIAYHGNDANVGKISGKALRALQRFTEAGMVDLLSKARLIMIGGLDEKKGAKKTMTVKYLKIAENAFRVAPGARMEAL